MAALVSSLRHALRQHGGAPRSAPAVGMSAPESGEAAEPMIIVDGYHCFGALPTDLSTVADQCCYVGCVILNGSLGTRHDFSFERAEGE